MDKREQAYGMHEGKMGKGRLCVRYLRERIWSIDIYFFIVITFFVVSGLNHIDNMSEMFYAVIIITFLGTCYLVYDFLKYSTKYTSLLEAGRNIEEMARMLPKADGLIEAEYQKSIEALSAEWISLQSRTAVRETEMAEYYLMWAHQIKTPIAAMKLLLQEGGSFALMEELFKTEQYVEMVLHYLRMESISADMVLKEYELQDLVKQAVKKYSVLFINNKIRLNLEEFTCTVITDEKWLSIVIEQILSNAIKYTRYGGITIYLDKNSPKTLTIEDSGIGIRTEDLPRIFEKGFTGYNGRMDKKSTGIGLYLCKQIADRLAHGILVSSEPEKGTKVSINLYRELYKEK